MPSEATTPTLSTSKQPRCAHSLVIVLLCSLLAAQALATAIAPALPDPGNPRMTRDQQQQLGLQVAAEVYKRMPVLPDSSPETKYIQKLGTRLYKTIPPEHSWPFQFHVVAQKEINAFALPGGPMFVNVGTITAAENEAELAGVMGHEMSHVYMQHSAKRQEKSSLFGGLAGLAGAIIGNNGVWGALAQSGIQFGAGTLMLKYSRGDEAQADAVGAIILWKAGYNPLALADFFEKIAKEGGGGGPQFLSDHPNPGNRRAAIEREVAEWPVREYRHNNAEFADVGKHATNVPVYSAQEIAAGAKSGRWAAENQKNGAIFPDAARAQAASAANAASVPAVAVTDVQPSSNFRSADLGWMKIDRPENWDVVQGQRSTSVTIAPKAGVAGTAVAYGVVIQAVQVPAANMNTPELTRSIAQSLEVSDSNMKQSGDIQSIAVNGAPAGSVELETASPMAGADGKPQGERDWLVAIPRSQGQAIFLVFVAPKVHFEQMKPTFEKMLGSVQF